MENQPDITQANALNASAMSYEQMRMEKLRRNQEIMVNLGLAQTVASIAPPNETGKKRPAVKKKRDVDLTVVDGPRRRSPRLSEPSTPGTKSSDASSSPSTELGEQDSASGVDEEQHPFDASKVHLYSIAEGAKSSKPSKQSANEGKSLRLIGGGASDPDLKRMYSLSFHEKNSIIAGGGHQGRVAVFSATCKANKEEELLLSFKASRGWISGVKFVKHMECGLLVSSNDGEMSLWDCTVQRDLQPKKLLSQPMHGKSGIFDLDLFEKDFVTSSKDGSLCLGQLGESAFNVARRINAHDGVSKSCMFQPQSQARILASAGNDCIVRVWDARSKSSQAQIEFESSFRTVLNVAKWNPSMPNLFLSASFASTMEMFDLRKAGEPAVLFKGHLPASCSRAQNIYQPTFVYDGKRVVASGGGSKNLTMFDTLTGDVVSSGLVGWEAGSSETSIDGNNIAVSHGCDVSFFECV